MKKVIFLISLCFLVLPLMLKGQDIDIAPETNGATVSITDFPVIDPYLFDEKVPFYFVFIEWGDCTFYSVSVSESTDWADISQTHNYIQGSVAFSPTIVVSVTPVYSNDDKPNMKRGTITVSALSGGGAPPITDYISDGVELKVFSSWDAGVQVSDTVQMVIAVDTQLFFDNGSPGGEESGAVYLYYNSNYVSPRYPRLVNPPSEFGRIHPLYFNSSARVGTVTGAEIESVSPVPDPLIPNHVTTYNARLKWNYSNRLTDRELLFFVDFVVKPEAGEQPAPQDISFLGIVTEETSADRVAQPQSIMLSDNIFEDIDTDALGILAFDVFVTQVATSRDPNSLVITPKQIIKGQTPATLAHTIHFQNKGNAPEDNIEVIYNFPAHIDSNSFTLGNVFLRGDNLPVDNVDDPLDNGTPDISMSDILVNGKKAGVKFVFTDANLLGLEQFLYNKEDSKGKITFTMKTLTPVDCEKISAKATIIFGTQSLTTPPAVVKCVDCEGKTNYLYWCLVFILALVVFLLAVWLVTLKMKQNSTT